MDQGTACYPVISVTVIEVQLCPYQLGLLKTCDSIHTVTTYAKALSLTKSTETISMPGNTKSFGEKK